ncbi:GOLPH3/VPS74 family protein [Cellulomonas fimi]|uniref:Golgi phosphoprotein 3 n=1 Tax=Cellulomonas fimi (strain ATCC 484 / DSM 20113 / JCM 1341 / CCUG 24087 / LMG 16345 / NBRC 15513 / NCIMB 8980 / NCTC 7547 / NRS-133) TaxID=590998 RepID=F4GZI1_CELFA|nr:GPP34 family phosphoprotein [Cellulomonas fimi]AEE44902.1 hypothetical protein Celf_0762 [Cellulomonas fimi ATCC 484]NNH08274.1 GPP34 family phosphoprotein [Cellulomonas fimi]VEH27627.1 Uncharacterised protein [Cellulomonas fimi]
MLLAEATLLLLTDPTTGRSLDSGQRTGLALAGSVLVELVQDGLVEITGKGHPQLAPGRVVVTATARHPDPDLDDALRQIAAWRRHRRPQEVVPVLARGLRATIEQRLVDAGVLRPVPVRFLGITWTTRHPVVDPAGPSAVLRQRLREVVVGSRQPDARDATLVAVLHALGRVPGAVGDVGLSRSEVRRRAAAIAKGDVGGEAVRRALQAAESATAAITASAVIAASTSSSS